MVDSPAFADVLQRYVRRSAYSAGQLSRLSGIPKTTIVSWLNGQVKKPHTAKGVLQLAKILHLSHTEAESLLVAAGYLPDFLVKSMAMVNGAAPFQAVPKLSYFCGRQQLMADIEATVLAEGERNIVCLQGMGGVGKTVLAAQLAYQLRPSFPDGVLWIEAARTGTLAALATMAHGYGLDVSPFQDVASRARVVRQLLADKRFLLVLDDVQTSVEIRDILPSAPGCGVLITTRRRDLVVAVGGQPFEIRPFSATDEEALTLFRSLLPREFTASEKEALRQIAELLGQLPLALAIAASRLIYEPGWHIHDFLTRLRQTDDLLNLLTYEELSVQRSLALSYQQLPDRLQQFLVGLRIFGRDSFLETAVAAIYNLPLADTQDRLRTLHNLSLVESHGGQTEVRYQLHPLVYFCLQKLPLDSQAAAEQNYIHYYLTLEQAGFSAVQEIAHLWSALRLAAQQKMWSQLFSGLVDAYPYLQSSVPLAELDTLLQTAEFAARQLGQNKKFVWCQLRRVALARRQAVTVGSAETLHSLTILTTEAGLARHRPAVCLERGKTAVANGNWLAASQQYEEGVHLAQKRKEQAPVLIELWLAQGNLARWRGQPQAATTLYHQALALAERKEDWFQQATLRDHLAWLAIERQDYDAADTACVQGIAVAKKISHQERLAILFNTLAVVRHHQENWGESRRYQQAAFDVARLLRLKARAAAIAASRGGLAWQNGRFKQAESFWEESDRLARQSQDVNMLVNVRLHRAEHYLMTKAYTKSLVQYQAVLSALPPQASRTSCGFGKGSLGIAQSLLGLEQQNAARPYLIASLTAFARVDVPTVAELHRLALSLQVDLEDIPQF